MGKIRGKDVLLTLTANEYPIVCGRSITFDFNNEFIDTSVTGTGRFRTFVPAGASFSGTIEGLATLLDASSTDQTIDQLYTILINGTNVIASWYEEDETGTYYLQKWGNIYIESISEVASFDNIVTFNATFKGSGPITINKGDV
jgi:predicted secreted protein